MPRPLPFTDDQLREAVQLSKTRYGVCRRLGLEPGGRTYKMLGLHIRRLGVDAAHLSLPGQHHQTANRRRWTEDDLRDVVRESHAYAEVMRRLGYVPSGGTHRWIKAKIQFLDIDTSHFTGQAWSAGLKNLSSSRRRPLEEILVAGSVYSSGDLRRRLIAAGMKDERCEVCGRSSWMGAELPLALDHINGDPLDNRIENLRILCPNCHAQTDTWCGRNRRRA